MNVFWERESAAYVAPEMLLRRPRGKRKAERRKKVRILELVRTIEGLSLGPTVPACRIRLHRVQHSKNDLKWESWARERKGLALTRLGEK
jgi:hypothetical protein